jgi:uncharacterized protein YcnI
MIVSSTPRSARTLRVHRTLRPLITAVLVVALPAIAVGHAVVYPSAASPGAYERYVLRVPNEKAVATTRVEIRFPADVRVVSFADVAGWNLEVLSDSAKRVIGAVWTGTLPPQRFIEFPFVAVNPATDARITWPAYQTYADGERVEWTGAEGSDRPASVTTIGSARAANGADAPWVRWAAMAAVILSLLSLGIAMRPRGTE